MAKLALFEVFSGEGAMNEIERQPPAVAVGHARYPCSFFAAATQTLYRVQKGV